MKTLLLQPDQQYGSLTTKQRVVFPAPPGARKPVYWWTLCACGKEKLILENSIRRGAVTSCGCRVRERLALPGIEAALRIGYRAYKKRAKEKGRTFLLSFEEYTEIAQRGQCEYCDQPATKRTGRRRKGKAEFIHQPAILMGLDRVDSSRGYEPGGQCVASCIRCNSSKGNRTLEQWAASKTAKVEKTIRQLERAGVVVSFTAPG